MGMRTNENGYNQWEWEGNGNKIRLTLGSEMEMGLIKLFLLISN